LIFKSILILNPSILRATISNTPINLYDYTLAADLDTFLATLNPNYTKVITLSSANRDFWIAHYEHPPPQRHRLSPAARKWHGHRESDLGEREIALGAADDLHRRGQRPC